MIFNYIVLHPFFFFLLIGFASSFSHISYEAFESQAFPGRNLLEAKKECKTDFEHQNYTIITSKCKGLQYQGKLCCYALKGLACPFSDDINDMSNNCASTMFSYINLYGKYPPGPFSSMCKEGKDSVECKDEDKKGDGSEAASIESSLLMLTSGLIPVLLV